MMVRLVLNALMNADSVANTPVSATYSRSSATPHVTPSRPRRLDSSTSTRRMKITISALSVFSVRRTPASRHASGDAKNSAEGTGEAASASK